MQYLILSVVLYPFYFFGQTSVEFLTSKTWQEHDGFAGTTLIFIQDDKQKIRAIRQINGSGVTVIGTEIYNVELKSDSVFLSSYGKKTEKRVYLMNQNVLMNINTKKVVLAENTPTIQLFSENDKLIGKSVNVEQIIRFDWDKKAAYIDDKLYFLCPLNE